MNELVTVKSEEAVCSSLWKSLYILQAEDGTIKIGVSKNVEQRIRVLQCSSGKKIVKSFQTQKCSNAYSIESIILEHYSTNRKCGEWITGNFDEVVSYAKEVFADKRKNEPSEEFYIKGAWSIFEKMCPVLKDVKSKEYIMDMTVFDLKKKLKDICEGFEELCGEDDEICTIPAKEKYEQLLGIIDFIEDLQRL